MEGKSMFQLFQNLSVNRPLNALPPMDFVFDIQATLVCF